MNGWTQRNIGSLVESVSDTFKFTDDPVVFLNTSDILAGKFLHANKSDPKTLPGQAKKRIKKGDLLFSEIRPANKRYALVKFDADNYVVSTKLMVLRSKGEIDTEYLRLFLTSDENLKYLQMIAEDRSGTFPQITFDNLAQMEIFLPDPNEQKSIASVLSSLDDKIDILHRQNKTLEAMAETLFRQWFVEEAGDWEEGKLCKIGHVITGKTPSTKQSEYWGNDIPFVTPTDFKNYMKFTIGAERGISLVAVDDFKKYVLPVNAILVTCIGSDMGKVALASSRCITNQQINSLIVDEKFPSIEYVYYFLKDIYPLLRSMALGGTTMPIINKSDFESISIPLPPEDMLLAFQSKAAAFSKKIQRNTLQINTLEKLRDSLLPKLMSGEVRVVNA